MEREGGAEPLPYRGLAVLSCGFGYGAMPVMRDELGET